MEAKRDPDGTQKRCVRYHPLLLMYVPLLVLFLQPTGGFAVAAQERTEPPRAIDGVLDLRNWDPGTDGPVDLDGEWHFFWNEFVAPSTVPERLSHGDGTIVPVPEYWNNYEIDGAMVPGFGYATYVLTILLPETNMDLALRTRFIQTAYSTYLGTENIRNVGKIGDSAESSVPQYSIVVDGVRPESDRIYLTIQVSNYHDRNGGIWEGIRLGDAARIRQNHEQALVLEVFLIASILVVTLFHLAFFLLRRSEGESLSLALFCIAIMLRSLVTGQIYITHLIPDIPWWLVMKIEYSTFYAAVPFFIAYLRSVFPRELPLPVLRVFQMIGAVFCAIVFVTPPIVFTHSVQPYQIVTIASGVFTVFVLVRALRRRRDGALILLFAFIVLFAAVINDILHANQIVHTVFLLPLGTWVFVMSQAFLITRRFAVSFRIAESLNDSLQQSDEQLKRSRIGLVVGLAKLAETRDQDTGSHLERIAEYSLILAQGLKTRNRYRDYIGDRYLEDLRQASILHDIGKVGVPDAVLLKPGKLTPEEFEEIKKHPIIGGDAISSVESRIGVQSFLTLGKEIAYSHHEKWDGTGYPNGLAGNDIPLSARIVALADVYDALTSSRPYKAAFSHEKALAIIVADRGTHFDSEIVDVFLEIESVFIAVRKRFHESAS